MKAPGNNESLKNIIIHLCWGDLDASKFFIEEIVESIKNRRTIHDLGNHFKFLPSILKLGDELQLLRLEMAFNFEG